MTMDFHMASMTEYQYMPDHMACDLTFYTDPSKCDTNGLLVAKLQTPTPVILSSFRQPVSSNELSFFYISDLVSLLNMDFEQYKDVCKRHKKCTGDVNFINYEDLQNGIECIATLTKMSRRLKIVGCTAHSVLSDNRKLTVGVCIQGHVTHPDNLVVEQSNFFDTKMDSYETIYEYMTTGVRQRSMVSSARQYRYGLGGSVIYLVVFKRGDTFGFLVLLTEEPIGQFIQFILESTEPGDNFDFIYTVIGRTHTEEESYPYILRQEGITFKDVIIECNESSFSQPILQTYTALHNIIHNTQKIKKDALQLLRKDNLDMFQLSPLKSLFHSTVSVDFEDTNDQLFNLLIQENNDSQSLMSKLREITIEKTMLADMSLETIEQNPTGAAFQLLHNFVETYISRLDLDLLRMYLDNLFKITNDPNVKEIESMVEAFVQKNDLIINKATHSIYEQNLFDSQFDDYNWDNVY